jgi:hypothetical protein
MKGGGGDWEKRRLGAEILFLLLLFLFLRRNEGDATSEPGVGGGVRGGGRFNYLQTALR